MARAARPSVVSLKFRGTSSAAASVPAALLLLPPGGDMSPAPSPTVSLQELSDEELDAYIRARLALLGVDLGVLPADDEEAPADQRRIMASARRFLRSTPAAVAEFEFDPLGPAPTIYPAGLSAWTRG